MTYRVNKHGCKPTEDVCMAHHRPLECRHGCVEAMPHRCGGYGTLKEPDERGVETRGSGPDPRRADGARYRRE